VLILQGELIQVVQEVINQRKAIYCVKYRYVSWGQTRVDEEVGVIQESV